MIDAGKVRRGRRSLWRTATVVAIASVCAVSAASTVIAEELFTAQDAAQSLQATDPTAVGADAGQQTAKSPVVEQSSIGFEVEQASVNATIPNQADDPITVQTGSGELKLEPQDVSDQATAGTAVNDNAAVVYANTGGDSDTSVVPTEKGVETFTNVRSEEASEDYSVKVDLPGDETVKQLDDHTVAIVDPTPNTKPDDAALPHPAVPGSPAGDAARATSGLSTPDPDPQASSKVAEAVEQAGTDKPAGVEDSEIEQPAALAERVSPDEQAKVGEAPDGADSGEPSKDEFPNPVDEAAAQRETDALAEQVARRDLENSQELNSAPTAGMNESNAQQSADTEDVIVAKVTAPASVDAEGDSVPTSLSVDGDVITMRVEHHGEDVAYPIAADPEYTIIATRWNLHWYPELRQETYISGWALGRSYVGNWHPVFCAWGWIARCGGAGVPAWYSAYQGASHFVAYWPRYDWGPVWQDYYYPVYATRWVVARWHPYWLPDLSSIVVLPVYDSGGDAVYEPGDEDEGYIEEDVIGDGVRLISGRIAKRPPCQYINRLRTVGWVKAPIATGNLIFRYCWNRAKRKVALDTQQVEARVEARLGTFEAIRNLGLLKIGNKKFTRHVLPLNGGHRGAFDGHGHFRTERELGVGGSIGPFGAEVKVDIPQTINDWGVLARYNGSWCPYSGKSEDSRRKTCGV